MADQLEKKAPRGLLRSWRRSPVLQVGSAYLVGAWLLLQVAEVFSSIYEWPPWVMQFITTTLVVMFPVVLLVAWFVPSARSFLPEVGSAEPDEPEVIDEQAAEILRLRGAELDIPVTLSERRQITTVACSVRGVRAGKDDPELLIGIVPAIEDDVEAIVSRYEGTRLASGRNEIVVAFGYPIIHEDDVRRAAKAGLQINALVYAQDKDDDPETFIISRAGLHTDTVVIDDVAEEGDALKLLGDNTSVAEWLQVLAPDNGIAMSAESGELLKHFFQLDEIGRFAHPRLGQDAPVFSLGTEYTGQLQQFIAGEGGDLVGRDNELQILLDHWKTVMDGESQFALITGEPGIGKSSLLYWAVRDLIATESPQLIATNCESYYQDTPLHPIVSHFERRIFASDFTLPHEERLSLLREFVETLPVDAEEATPFFASLLSVEYSDPGLLGDISGKLFREKTLQMLVDSLHGLADRQPVLLVIEDLHWADPTTLDLISNLLTASPDHRIYGLFTTRSQFPAEWGSFSHVFGINLSRLPSRASEELVRRRLGDRQLPDSLVDRIVRESGGIPLYLEELISGLQNADDTSGDGETEELSIPPTLQTTLAARVDRLGSSKPLLQLCSVLGQEFSYQILKEVIQSDDEKLLRKVLAELVNSGMLYQKSSFPDATYRFKHRLHLDAAYQSLLKSTLRQLHGAIANTIEVSFPEFGNSFPARLAQHFGRAGEADKAVGYRIKAGRSAQQQFANDEAMVQLERGFELLAAIKDPISRNFSEMALQNLKGSVLIASKGYTYPDALDAFERAVELSESVESTPELFLMMVGLWMYYLIKGDNVKAMELSKRLVSLAEESGAPPELVQAHYCVGYSHYYVGDVDHALVSFRQAVEHERPGFDYSQQTPSRDDTRVHLHCMLAQALWYVGESVQAQREQESALSLAIESNQPYAQVWSRWQAAMLHHMRRDFAPMQEAANQCVSMGADKGFSFFVPLGEFLQSTQIEDPDERLSSMVASHELTMRTGARAASSYLKSVIAEELIGQGRLDEAEARLHQINDLVTNNGERLWQSEHMRLEAELKLARNELSVDGAADILRQSVAFSRKINNKPFALRSALKLFDIDGGSAESAALIDELIGTYPVPDTTSEFERAKKIVATETGDE